MRLTMTLAAAMLALPLPLLAHAAGPQPDVPAAEPGKKVRKAKVEDPNKLICKQEKKTGSRMAPSKTCLTAREWQARADLAREGMDDRIRPNNEY